MSTSAPGTERATVPLTVLSPRGVLYEGDVRMVIAPSVAGDVAILARHAPLEAILRVGETRVRLVDDSLIRFATGEGYMTVEGNNVLILVEQGEEASTIDRERAQGALQRAERQLASLPEDDAVGRKSAERAKERAENRLRISAEG
ncbi:MAG: ATP synthase F1 subunit epsilon [Thermoleophilia bacterium]|nr:ATP synthase F1 subunit epsilon [Thermoleophilia bacterium]MDH3724291.1 ATP synthase F1 subunit epsilon [Thermoleophilia bacterium]